MLVVSNGAFKSGSTWLFTIAKLLVPHAPLPEAFRAPGWTNDSLNQPTLDTFLATVDRKKQHFVVKNHLEKLSVREQLLAAEDVVVLSITRDLRDTIVSAYYHDVRNEKFEGDFEVYFQTRGRERLYEISRYHRVWEKPDPHLFQTTYEDLHRDFAGEVRRLAAFLDREVTPEEIERIRAKTSFDRVQKGEQKNKGETNALFFRKGVIGDWKNHLNESMEKDLQKIIDQVKREKPGYVPGKSFGHKLLKWMGLRKKRV